MYKKSGSGIEIQIRNIPSSFLLPGILLFAAGATAESTFWKLAGKQIAAEIAGMELTDESHWGEVFERNGTLIITSMEHRSVGKWRVQKGSAVS